MSEKKQWELVYDEKGENPVVARVEAYRALMMLTGFDYTSEHKLVNGYVSDRGTGNPQYSQPWMMFMTTWGPVVVGWRKRVINIEWHDSKYPSLVVEPPDLYITHGPGYIHCYGYGEALAALERLKFMFGRKDYLAALPEGERQANVDRLAQAEAEERLGKAEQRCELARRHLVAVKGEKEE